MFRVLILFYLDMYMFQILIYSITSYICDYKSNICLLQSMQKYIAKDKGDTHSEIASVEIVVCIPKVFL